jgi:hypothetical protein
MSTRREQIDNEFSNLNVEQKMIAKIAVEWADQNPADGWTTRQSERLNIKIDKLEQKLEITRSKLEFFKSIFTISETIPSLEKRWFITHIDSALNEIGAIGTTEGEKT